MPTFPDDRVRSRKRVLSLPTELQRFALQEVSRPAGIGMSWLRGSSEAGVYLKLRGDQGTAGTEDDLCIENGCPAPALGGICVTKLSLREVVGLGDLVRQPAVHQGVVLTTKLLAPHPILNQPLKDLVQAESREIFTPN
jgi:hypothetical protein